MKINETILKARKELGLTQEQVADRLGVTASAVYKWEKGSAYPDITMLAPLARLLKMDLNTLLSFHRDLTPKEISAMVQEVIDVIEKQGYDAGFNLAMDKVREYAGCDLLVANMAASMEGAKMLYSVKDTDKYEGRILELYQGLKNSEDERVRNQVNHTLFYHYLNRKQYDEAEEIFRDVKPENPMFLQMQSELYLAQGKNEEAKKGIQQKLLGAAGDVQSALMKLHSIALKEDDMETARYLAGKNKQVVEVLELWKYGAYTLYFELYVRDKDIKGSLEALREMWESMSEPWKAEESLLYRYIKPATPSQDSSLQKRVRPMLLDQLRQDESLAFLRESKEGAAFLRAIEEEQEMK